MAWTLQLSSLFPLHIDAYIYSICVCVCLYIYAQSLWCRQILNNFDVLWTSLWAADVLIGSFCTSLQIFTFSGPTYLLAALWSGLVWSGPDATSPRCSFSSFPFLFQSLSLFLSSQQHLVVTFFCGVKHRLSSWVRCLVWFHLWQKRSKIIGRYCVQYSAVLSAVYSDPCAQARDHLLIELLFFFTIF